MSECCVVTHPSTSCPSNFVDQLHEWPRKIVAKALQWLSGRRQQYLNSRTFEKLAMLDDATLKDIGLSRGDVIWAHNQPDSAQAATELQIISRRKTPVN